MSKINCYFCVFNEYIVSEIIIICVYNGNVLDRLIYFFYIYWKGRMKKIDGYWFCYLFYLLIFIESKYYLNMGK